MRAQHHATASKWPCDLAIFAGSGLRIFVLLPADRVHGVSGLAYGHDDAEFVTSRREVIIGLVAQGYLFRLRSVHAFRKGPLLTNSPPAPSRYRLV
jgi:hypothetical protein